MVDKRLIEVDFPLEQVSKESEREKYIRHGHISTLHVWWARRPLAASRATTFSALIPAPKNHDKLIKKLEFVAELSKWENSQNKRLIENVTKEIKNSFRNTPKVLDCFAGGGSIPLESMRLGCETYASEYNPIAVLLLKAALEYPQKFKKGTSMKGELQSISYPLLEDVKKWGNRILNEVNNEMNKFYPLDPDGNIPVSYIWARTISCKNPSCGVEIPLIRQFWLAKKKNKTIALKMLVDKKNKKISFTIVRGKEINFNPSQGTTRRATVQCPVCGAGMNAKTVRREGKEGRIGQKLVAVCLYKPNTKKGKIYRVVNTQDINVFEQAEKYLEYKIKNWRWDFNPIPDEPIPSGEGPGAERAFSVRNYGLYKWGDLFNSRQKLALITFIEKTKDTHKKMLENGIEEEYAVAVSTYLALALDMLVAFTNTLARWENTSEAIKQLYSRQTLSMMWDYAEVNPFSGSSGSFDTIQKYNLKVIEHCYNISNIPTIIMQSSATSLPYSDYFFDAVITDPPYYDNVPYSDLSDFFYVWLKRIIGNLYPNLFATPLTPKSHEIIVHTLRHGHSFDKAKNFFENMITTSFREIHRVLKSDGIAVIVFAYKSTDAWETIINSLLKAGLVLTASWPIHTEMRARLRAMESAALASSVYMVCRKRVEVETAYFNEIRDKIEVRIKEKLTQFWEQGISGADFFVSAIGPAVEVFGRYSKVEKLTGDEVTIQELLEHVRKVVSEFALERVIKSPNLGGVDSETRFYLLWRWTFGNARVHFDDAIKLSRPMGVEVTNLWDSGGLIRKMKEYVRVLTPMDRAKDSAFMKKRKLTSMIEALHYALVLWSGGERERIKEVLDESGYAGNEMFWQTAQAISEVLPDGDKEKQLLQGFLYGKETYSKDAIRQERSLLDFMERSR